MFPIFEATGRCKYGYDEFGCLDGNLVWDKPGFGQLLCEKPLFNHRANSHVKYRLLVFR